MKKSVLSRSRFPFLKALSVITGIAFIILSASCFDDSSSDSASGTDQYHGVQTVASGGDAGKYNSIAVSGSNVYIAYYNATDGDLKFAKMTDYGASWPVITDVDTTGDVGQYLSMAASGDNIYISYYDATNQDLKFARSADGGTTWTVSTIVSTDNSGYGTSIAISENTVYISYSSKIMSDGTVDQTNGHYIWLTKSTDNGTSWQNIFVVYESDITDKNTDLAVAGNNLYIYFRNGSSFRSNLYGSTDGGETWNLVYTNLLETYSSPNYRSLVVNGSNLYVCGWLNESSFYLNFRKSTDSGTNWQNIRTLDVTSNTTYIDVMDLTAMSLDNDTIYISYYDITDQNLKLAKMTGSGDHWPSVTVIDENTNRGTFPSMVVLNGVIYVSYYDITNGDLMFAKSLDGGKTW